MAEARFDGPLFLVGMPRSGTKLLRDLLKNHPQIAIPAAETELLPAWAAAWPGGDTLASFDAFQRFAARWQGAAYFTYLREEQSQEVDLRAWFAASPRLDLPGVFEGLVRASTGAAGEVVWGDKSPGYIAHLPLLWQFWPQARVVHIVRDVRDYALSMQKAWGKDPVRAAQRWSDRVTEARIEGAARGPGRYLELHYEALVTDPAPTLAAVCRFAGLAPAPGMDRLQRPAENLGRAAGSTAVLADNVARWRAEMPPALLQAIEAVAGPTLAAAGYPRATAVPERRLGAARLLAAQVQDGLRLVRFDAAHRGWLGAARFRWRLFRETGAPDAGPLRR